jgi:hypothetical protein
MTQLIAFCGLDCSKCDAYLATQSNDDAAKERVLAQWRTQFNLSDVTLAAVTCDGCITPNGRLGGYCKECPIRACGTTHQVANCAHCAEYDTCDKLAGFLASVPQARVQLDEIRRAL